MLVPLVILVTVFGLMFFKDTTGKRNKIMKYILMAANILLVCVIIISNYDMLPIHPTYFLIGIFGLTGCFALYFIYRNLMNFYIRKTRNGVGDVSKNEV